MIGDEDGEVTLWDIALQTELVSVRHTSADRSIDQIAVSPDGDRMATATSGGEVILWDVSRLSNDPEGAIAQDSDRPLIPAVSQLRGYGAASWPEVRFLSFSDDNGRLFIGDRNGGLSQVSASSGSQLDGPIGANRTPIAVSANGTHAFMLSSDSWT
jgi:WD40 repeat protein